MKLQSYYSLTLCCVLLLFTGSSISVEKDKNTGEKQQRMDNQRLEILIKRIDPKVQGQLGHWTLEYKGVPIYVITDEKSDRMRIVTPVIKVENIKVEEYKRMMQANFDSALDARYAVAKDIVWGVFIHPLGSLTDKDFFSGLGQAITLVATYGSTYSSGAFLYQGGDSKSQQEKYYQDIIDLGKAI